MKVTLSPHVLLGFEAPAYKPDQISEPILPRDPLHSLAGVRFSLFQEKYIFSPLKIYCVLLSQMGGAFNPHWKNKGRLKGPKKEPSRTQAPGSILTSEHSPGSQESIVFHGFWLRESFFYLSGRNWLPKRAPERLRGAPRSSPATGGAAPGAPAHFYCHGQCF